MSHLQCVLLHDVLYVGGGYNTKLFMSKIVTKPLVWDVCRTPTESYALTTYHSQLVLVGGREPSTLEPSNMLWTLSSDAGMNWQPSIQEMPTKRWLASAMNIGTPEYLVVAGGVASGKGDKLDTVEVFTGKVWCTVEPLPKPCCYAKGTLHEGKYFLCGGDGQDKHMYSCDIELLLKSCEESGANVRPFSLWRQLHAPFFYSTLASFGQHLVSIGGRTYTNYSYDIYALSLHSQLWVRVGKQPIALYSAPSIILPTGELIVVGQNTGRLTHSARVRVFKATIRGEDTVMVH